ncbi:MAG: hypothetical protein PHS09_07435, partial [Candidatus Omnitrophica bacterium]|nr:hypothetical protein [Candidatus Omnitrophota bacterium]
MIIRNMIRAGQMRAMMIFLCLFRKEMIFLKNRLNKPKNPRRKAAIQAPAPKIVKPVPGSIYPRNITLNYDCINRGDGSVVQQNR